MTTEQIMMAYPLTRKAWETAGKVWVGLAIPCDKSTVAGGTIRSEKVLKFARKPLLGGGVVREKVDPRYNGGDDNMIIPVGKQGSPERIEALAHQYGMILASGEEVSPFGGD